MLLLLTKSTRPISYKPKSTKHYKPGQSPSKPKLTDLKPTRVNYVSNTKEKEENASSHFTPSPRLHRPEHTPSTFLAIITTPDYLPGTGWLVETPTSHKLFISCVSTIGEHASICSRSRPTPSATNSEEESFTSISSPHHGENQSSSDEISSAFSMSPSTTTIIFKGTKTTGLWSEAGDAKLKKLPPPEVISRR